MVIRSVIGEQRTPRSGRRPVHLCRLLNGCSRWRRPDGTWSDPYYYFSINADTLPQQPWRAGTVYILPRAGFEPQPEASLRGARVSIAQWASLVSVRPLARLPVGAADFPFLAQIHGHDLSVITQCAARDPEGFPCLDESGDGLRPEG